MQRSLHCLKFLFRFLIPASFITASIILFQGCAGVSGRGESGGCPSPVTGGDCSKGLIITVCSNHGHFIQKSDLESIMGKGPQSYDIRGNSGHTHTIHINGGYYFKLQRNQGIQLISSSSNGHTHLVTINCAK